MSKLEKFLAKAREEEARRTVTVTIDGEEWSVRELTLSENRFCEKLGDKGDTFDWYRYNDARIVKATEHEFPWNSPELLKAYGAADKYELVAKLFDRNPEGYAKLLQAVRQVSRIPGESELIEEAKN